MAGRGCCQIPGGDGRFLKTQGTIQNVLPDYSSGVNATWVRKAAQ